MAFHSFDDREVWKLACRVAVQVYGDLRDCRDFGLRDQMTSAAVSIASNIAEGAERSSRPDFIRFLNIAKGSAAELRTQIYIATGIDVLTAAQQANHITDLRHLSAMLHALTKSLSADPKAGNRTPKT